MSNQISAQKMFNGAGYDLQWLLSKAERELQRAKSNKIDFAGDAANFAVTIAHAADWAFALKPANFASFQTFNDIVQWIHVQSPQTALFFDVSNEFKHADRARPSKVTAQLYLEFEVVPAEVDAASKDDGKRIFVAGSSGSTWILTPVIKDRAGNEYLFKDCAEEAVRWWKSVI